ncbi:MAG: TetR/AcrR family transcriptional regulator [bacterium]|nr:TetR/AcrR family transcriptional regulator [bacterium]
MKRAPASTKERLLRTAERMFALHGINAVSMRSICAEANQRNNTALQYHFGDKQTLVEAILVDRMGFINERRQAMLEQIHSDGCEADLHRLVAALVTPFTEQLCDEAGGRYYVRFAAQLFSRGNAVDLLAKRRLGADAFHSIVDLIRACLGKVPEQVMAGRLTLMASQLVHATAAKEYELAASGPRQRSQSIARFADDLVDYVVGGLTAPVSEERRKLAS